MTVEPHIYLKRGKKNILLVRYHDKLHFVNLDHRMHRKVKAWFLDAPRTEEEMDEKRLVRTTHALKSIRGVAAGGIGRGQVVQFYLQEGKRRYELARDCDLADMSALFDGLESFTPPQQESNWQDPRLAKQDPALRNKLWALGIILNLISYASGFFIWAVGFEVAWVCVAALLCIHADFVLYCLFPDYFTMFPEKPTYGQKKAVMGLHGVMVCPACMLLGAMSEYALFNWWKAWLIGAAALVVLAVILYMTAPMFRDGDKLAMVLIAGLFLSGGPVLMLNNLMDFSSARVIQTEVVDKEKHTSRKSPDRYDVTVILDGEERDIPVDAGVYSETEIGDLVTLELHEGAFGIPYAEIE